MVWLFGYGSLIWKTEFSYIRKEIGYLTGYKRRFYWWSIDHRGVPGAPGRVVNILPSDDPNERVWGVAYEISDSEWFNEIGQILDHRERGGYVQKTLPFYSINSSKTASFNVIVYLGSISNEQYAGIAPLQEMAQTISSSVGPSGSNKEYLYNLANAMRDLSIDDEHIFELEKAVKLIEEKDCQTEHLMK